MPRRRRATTALAAALALLLTAPAVAPGEAGALAAQAVRGIVLDDATGAPLPAAAVTLLDSAGAALRTTETADDGRFRIAVDPAAVRGPLTLRAERLGYAPATSQAFRIEGDALLEVELRLTTRPIPLPPVAVRATGRSARLAGVGFYQRRDVGIGRYITADDIAARSPFVLTDLFRTEPSVDYLYDDVRQRWVVVFRGAARMSFDTTPCWPLLVLDGTRLSDSGVMDELVDPLDVAGIEIYPSGNGAPVQFTGLGAPCGVILIWTRRS